MNLALEQLKFSHQVSEFSGSEELSSEILFLSNFSKYQKLVADPELRNYLTAKQMTDFKPKLTSLLCSDLYRQKISSQINKDTSVLIDLLKNLSFNSPDLSSEDRIILTSLTSVIFEKWDKKQKKLSNLEDYSQMDFFGMKDQKQRQIDTEKFVLSYFKILQ